MCYEQAQKSQKYKPIEEQFKKKSDLDKCGFD
jgi:hypothetical protein